MITAANCNYQLQLLPAAGTSYLQIHRSKSMKYKVLNIQDHNDQVPIEYISHSMIVVIRYKVGVLVCINWSTYLFM